MLGIGMQELVIIFAIVMVIFGAKKLPQMGEGIGKGIRNFKRSLNEKEETHSPQEKP
jgi:sec-independent protein translocase protein TatA